MAVMGAETASGMMRFGSKGVYSSDTSPMASGVPAKMIPKARLRGMNGAVPWLWFI